MRLTYFGHSTFLLEAPGARLVFDPWLRNNPHGAVDPAQLPCDYVFCSHAHLDQCEDALPLARLHGATIVAPYELAEYYSAQGVSTLDLMPGGGVTLPWGRIKMTPAVHSSALELAGGENKPMGVASGFVVSIQGRQIYHAGDTALFGDMALIGRMSLDVALLPIGDFYTMGPDDALEALNLLQPKLAIPIHYNSNAKIQQDPRVFATRAREGGHEVRVLAARETIEI